MVDGLLGCWVPTSTKLRTKIHQVGDQNRPRWGSKSFQIGARGASWRGLGAILAHLGPKRPPRAQNAPQCKDRLRPFGRHFGSQNRSKIDLEAIQKVIIFLIVLKIDCWSDLVPSWLHLAKWCQVGSKIDSSWGVDLRAVLEGILAPFLSIFHYNMTWPK